MINLSDTTFDNNSGRSEELDTLSSARTRQQEVLDLVNRTKNDLARVYGDDSSEESKRKAKHELLEELRERYLHVHAGWQGSNDYYAWMMAEMNNAKLGTLSTYNDWVESFNAILTQEDHDLVAFIDRVKQLARLDRVTRDQRLKELANTGLE